MYMETVSLLRQTEEQLDRERAAARAAAQQLQEQARREGRALLEQTKQDQRQLDRESQKQSLQQAQQRRDEVLRATEAECRTLRQSARVDRAAEKIFRRVVEG